MNDVLAIMWSMLGAGFLGFYIAADNMGMHGNVVAHEFVGVVNVSVRWIGVVFLTGLFLTCYVRVVNWWCHGR